MEIKTFLKKIIEETHGNYLKIESQLNDLDPVTDPSPGPGPRPRPPPPPRGGPGDCSAWYIWAAIIVIIIATASLIVILVYFCRRNKRDRSGSLDAIITNIELQNHQIDNSGPLPVPTVVPNLKDQQVIRNGDGRIIIIQKY